MTQPPQPPSSGEPHDEPTEIVGRQARNPSVRITLDLGRLPSAGTAFGVALLFAAVILSSNFSRDHGDLDVSNFVMGVLATLALLAIATGARLLAPDSEARSALVSWPGAAGALGAGLVLDALITNDTASTYTASLVALAIAIVGYLVTRAAAFVLAVLVAAVPFYGQLFDDVVGFDVSADNGFMVLGAAVLVFVLLATAAGWLLPRTRVLTAMVVGVGGLAAMAGLLLGIGVFRSLSGLFTGGAGFSFGGSGKGLDVGPGSVHGDPFENDAYLILLYCVVLVVLWTGCALATGHVGFRLLVLATPAVIVPLAAMALLTRHPTWWEVVAAGLGGLVLLAVGARNVNRPVAPEVTP